MKIHKDKIKALCFGWFYYWTNQTGTNSNIPFEEWLKNDTTGESGYEGGAHLAKAFGIEIIENDQDATDVPAAVRTVMEALRTDKFFRDTWKANIVTAFLDETYLWGDQFTRIPAPVLIKLGDLVADRFLNLLTQQK